MDTDFSQAYVLVRLYEVNDDEDVVRDITWATNSQNPVDFRDLKSNDNIQQLLELGSRDLGYEYKRKREGLGYSNAIPSTVAAESVLAIWRGMPHLAKYRRNEFFDKFYDIIFKDLNAAQMIIAVLIFRYCDNKRKQISTNEGINAQRPYSQYFLAYIVGRRLLKQLNMKLDGLNHANFCNVKQYFDNNREQIYIESEAELVEILKDYFNNENIEEIDGRTMAAVFRRFDIMFRYLQ